MFEQVYEFVIEQIGKNDLVAGGACLGALAFILSYLRSFPFLLLKWLRLLFVTQIDIPDRADTFRWVGDWLAAHQYAKKAKRITIEAIPGSGGEAKITPAPGRHLVWWNRTPVLITRIRREGTGDNAHRSFREGWSITLLGRRSKVEAFIEDCRKVSQAGKDQWLSVREPDHDYWNDASDKRKRSLDTVILPEGMKQKLTDDLETFIASEDWYNEMCIPWRRGYLLSGPPGNGKSSLITAVASEVDFKIYIINLKHVSEPDLSGLVSSIGRNSILLLEDVDCAFNKRKGKGRISLSTLLNCLDGVAATEGRIVFMTTNHPEKLDPALTRPGRVDLTLELPDATEYQATRLFNRFFPDSDHGEEFGKRATSQTVSMAKIQGHLLEFRDSDTDALANVRELRNA